MPRTATPSFRPTWRRAALEAAERASQVTRSLLAVARNQPLQLVEHDLNEVLMDLLPLIRSSMGSDVSLYSQFASRKLWTKLDISGLGNLVLNLVVNALDAMRGMAGEPLLTLRTRLRHLQSESAQELAVAPGWYAGIEVSDNGRGMSEAVRARAFEPFFSTKVRGEGTGLGLATVHGFARQLGGTARLESTVGLGTTVEVFLPLEASRMNLDESAEAARVQALRAHAILDTPAEAEFDALVAEAARLCQAPTALVSLVEADRQWFKAKIGMAAEQTAREQAFCAHAIMQPGTTMVVPDASRDARFSANPLVTGAAARGACFEPRRPASGIATSASTLIGSVTSSSMPAIRHSSRSPRNPTLANVAPMQLEQHRFADQETRRIDFARMGKGSRTPEIVKFWATFLLPRRLLGWLSVQKNDLTEPKRG